jgi:hypothetical protein
MLKLKPERISNFMNLTDDEILSGAIYCKKLIDRKEEIFKDEFFGICFFIFNGDEKSTVKALDLVMKKYMSEYSERRKN